MEKIRETWTDLSIKEKLNYAAATLLITSGIVLAFLSFFLNLYNITNGVLFYIAQAFITGGSLMGATIYINRKVTEETRNSLSDIVSSVIEKIAEGTNK